MPSIEISNKQAASALTNTLDEGLFTNTRVSLDGACTLIATGPHSSPVGTVQYGASGLARSVTRIPA